MIVSNILCVAVLSADDITGGAAIAGVAASAVVKISKALRIFFSPYWPVR
jgi:hypothetical protein